MVAERVPAPKDGIQIYNGTRLRAIRGELMMPGATFEDPSVTQAAHQDYLASASTAAQVPADPESAKQVADLQAKNAALEARLAALEAQLAPIPTGTGPTEPPVVAAGPTETTESAGPTEATDAKKKS